MKTLSILLALAASAIAAPAPHLIPGLEKDPQNLLFIGDSITHGFSDSAVTKGDHYHGILQAFFTLRYPEKAIWSANTGRCGDNLGGLLSDRMDERDVFKTFPGVADKADVAFIMYGMNDGGSLGYTKKDKPPSDESRAKRLNDYRGRLTAAVKQVREREIVPIILSPTIYDETVKKNVMPAYGFNAELGRYSETAAEVAKETGVQYIDLHTLMTAKNADKQKDNPKFSYTWDRVHPHAGGSALIAYSVLKGLGLERDVFHAEIDAISKKASPGVGVEISDVKDNAGTLSWTATENSLPFPIDTKTYRFDSAFADVPFQQEFNRQFLKVSGLAPGKYALSINGTEITTFSAEEIATGVDLSPFQNTPQYTAASEIRTKLFRKQELDIIRRDINSLRLNLEGYYRQDVKRKDEKALAILTAQEWDAADADVILPLLERQLAEKKEDGKGTGGYFGHVAGQTKRNLPKIKEINAELATIRKEIVALPATRKYEYALKKN